MRHVSCFRAGLMGSAAALSAGMIFGLATPTHAQNIAATYTGPTNGDHSWDNPLNWSTGVVPDNFTGGGPTDVIFNVASPVVMPTFHTIANLTGPDNYSTNLQLDSDLRLSQGSLADINIDLALGADLIFDGTQNTFTNSRLTALPTTNGRTPRLTLNSTSLSFIDATLVGPDDTTTAAMVLGTTPNATSDAKFIFAGPTTHAYPHGNTLRGRILLEAPVTVAAGSTLNLFKGSLRDNNPSGTIKAPLTVGPGGTLNLSNTWDLGTNGSIHMQDHSTLEFEHNFLSFPLIPRGVVPLAVDLSRITFEDSAKIRLSDSATLTQILGLASQTANVSINQTPVHFLWRGQDPLSDVPFTATDLQGGTFNPLTLFPDNVTVERITLANGTLVGESGGPVAFGSKFPDAPPPSSGSGEGYDPTNDFGVRAPTALFNMTIVGGIKDLSVRMENSTVLGGSIQRDINIGNPIASSDIPSSLPGTSTFVGVTIPQNVVVRVYHFYQTLQIKEGLELNGIINTSLDGDYIGGGISFVGTQTLSGTGTIHMTRGNLGNGSISVEDGDLTIGPGITINHSKYGSPLHAGSDNNITLQGTLNHTNNDRTVSRGIVADTFRLKGTLRLKHLGYFNMEIAHMIVAPSGVYHDEIAFYRFDETEPDQWEAEISGDLTLEGGKLVIDSLASGHLPDLDFLGSPSTFIKANSITGTFDSVDLPSLGNGRMWAAVYTANTLDMVIALAGDANLNQQVDQGDLDLVLQNWGRSNFTDADADLSWATGDMNGNGIVEQGDLDLVLQHWGSAATPDFAGFSIPEPATLGVFALMGLHRRRGGA